MRIAIKLCFLLCAINISAQESSKILKQIEKINRKNDFTTFKTKYFDKPNDCNFILTGNYGKGPSDGGGAYNKSVKNLKKINLNDKSSIDINDYDITLPFSTNHNNFNYLLRIKSKSNELVGLINNCGEMILEPKYNHINGFNENGLAVCFKDNSIQIIDSEGNEILKKSIDYKVPYDTFWTIPSAGIINRLKVIGNSIILKNNDSNSLFNIKSQEIITTKNYNTIDDEILELANSKYLRATTDNATVLIDIENGQELGSDIFSEIINVKKFYDKEYIYGYTISNKSLNIYDPENKTLIFPKDLNIDEILATDNSKNNNYKHIWILYSKSLKSRYIYDSEEKKILVEPESNLKNIYNGVINKTLLVTYDDCFKAFNLETKKFQNIRKGYKPILLYLRDNSNNKAIFLRYNLTPDSYIIYDNNWNVLEEDLKLYSIKSKGDIIYFYELVNGEKKYTAYDINGKIIGNKREYNPK